MTDRKYKSPPQSVAAPRLIPESRWVFKSCSPSSRRNFRRVPLRYPQVMHRKDLTDGGTPSATERGNMFTGNNRHWVDPKLQIGHFQSIRILERRTANIQWLIVILTARHEFDLRHRRSATRSTPQIASVLEVRPFVPHGPGSGRQYHNFRIAPPLQVRAAAPVRPQAVSVPSSGGQVPQSLRDPLVLLP